MAVQPQTPYKEYTANGSANSFALEFDCENQDHLIVLVDDMEPVIGTWSLSGGAVVFGTAPTSGKKITIQRNTPFRRDEDFQSYDNSFRPPGVNNGFDKIWLKLQELGVADWILGNRIDALKKYVDDRDDELRAYLMEEIRKQGVALDQLDDYYNYLMERLAQIAVDRGWEASFIVDKNGRNQQEINDDDLRLRDYAKYKIGNDWTAAIQRADNDAIAQSKCVNVAGGTYDYSGNITLSGHWFGSGLHCTRFRKTAPATITILNGSLRDLSISPDNQIVGDTTHGLVADGVDRKYIENVLTEKHGGDGFVYKRGNLSRFFLRSRSNGGRGVTFANDTISGDNKACEVWFECTANKKSGFFMENSATTSQNSGQHRGFIIAQSNGSDAIVDDNYNAVLSGNYNDLQLYTEYGGGVWHKASLKGSKVFYSNISHPLFRDEAGDSNIVSYIPSGNGTRATKNEIFEKLTIYKENSSYSGKLSLSQTANNTFSFEATSSNDQQHLELPANLTLRGVGNSYGFAKINTGGATLNFSTVAAQSAVERTITVTNITLSSLQTAAIASPAGDVGAGLVWSAFVSAFDAAAKTANVTIRVANPTAAAVTSNQLAWRIQIVTA